MDTQKNLHSQEREYGYGRRIYEKERNKNMVTECNNPDKIKQKNAADMTFKEMMEEMQANTPSGTRVWYMLKYMDFLYDDKQKEIDSLRTELRSANAKLSELKKKMTEPEVKSEDQEQVLQTGHIEMIYDCSMDKRLLAYCEGMADAANHIMYYIETETAEDDS